MRELIQGIHWRSHTFSLIRLGLAFALLVASAIYNFESKDAQIIASTNQDAQLYANDEAELFSDIIADHIGEYSDYKDRGLIGPPNRLNWVESFRLVANQLQLPGVEFTLEQSEPAQQYVDAYWDPEVEIRVTDMKVTMRLSHEGNLHQFLTELENESDGLFSVDRCAITWLNVAAVEMQTTRLRGECYLRWYSLADVTTRWREIGT